MDNAIPWFGLLGRFPYVAERVQLLRRIWDSFGLLDLTDREQVVVYWAGQMAAAGETERALREVENLNAADRRAQGFMEISLVIGLVRDEKRALAVFDRFLDALKSTEKLGGYPTGFCEALQRGCGECVQAGAHARLFEIIDAVKKTFFKKWYSFRDLVGAGVSRKAFGIMLTALASTGRTDQWELLLNELIKSKIISNWNWSEISYLIEHVLEQRPGKLPTFTQQQRLSFLEKMFELARVANVTLATTEAKVLNVCLDGAEDPWQLINRFEELSECSPKVVKTLLERDPLRSKACGDLPEFPSEPVLRWIASICPFSDEAALAFVEHAAARCLEQDDWAALKAIAVECSVIDLSWLERLADAVLESERDRARSEA